MYLLFTDFDIGFDTTSNMAIGTSGVATPTILQPTWGEWGNWTECAAGVANREFGNASMRVARPSIVREIE